EGWMALDWRSFSESRWEDKTMARKSGLPISLLTGIAMLAAIGPASAQPTREVVVFDFEMMDTSAGAGIIPADELDARYLAEATEVAKNYLRTQGTYTIVDAGSASADI